MKPNIFVLVYNNSTIGQSLNGYYLEIEEREVGYVALINLTKKSQIGEAVKIGPCVVDDGAI